MGTMRIELRHILLEKACNVLQLLRKLELSKIQESAEETKLASSMDKLVVKLQNWCDGDFSALTVMSPFIKLLETPILSAPYKLAALDAIQYFFNYNVFESSVSETSDYLVYEELVSAITGFKIMQTDAYVDEFLQLNMIVTLHSLILSPTKSYLRNSTIMMIIEVCHSILLLEANTAKPAFYQATERTLNDILRWLFGTQELRSCSNNNFKPKSPPSIDSANAAQNLLHYDKSLCVTTVLKYFLKHLQAPIKKSNSEDQTNSQNQRSKRASFSGPLSHGSGIFGFNIQNSRYRGPCLALKAIHIMLLGNGRTEDSRIAIMKNGPFFEMLRTDLSYSLLNIATSRETPIELFQLTLLIFTTMYRTIGPTLLVFTECFFRFVHLKAVHDLSTVYSNVVDVARVELNIGNNSNPAEASHIYDACSFGVQEMEAIHYNLLDLVSDAGFLCSLFLSFDCNPMKPDVLVPLVGGISRSFRDSLGIQMRSGDFGDSLIILTRKLFGQLVRVLALTSDPDRTLTSSNTNKSTAATTIIDESSANNNSNDHRSESETADFVFRSIKQGRELKQIYTTAATKFAVKPKLCFKYLQDRFILPTPLTASAIAQLLRSIPNLSKVLIGAYLGELGNAKSSNAEDTEDFHKSVLKYYVESFTIAGESFLNCLRIFLSAFRLPGEAQQIDRILVSFSEHCFSNCVESKLNIFDNPDIVYLLSFSIIMLNTDRHNPNIKVERKMTLEQFIRNNTNYGSDVQQLTPLPKDFLVSLYSSISDYPLTTERNDISAKFNYETWMDLYLQSTSDKKKSVMKVVGWSPATISWMNRLIFESDIQTDVDSVAALIHHENNDDGNAKSSQGSENIHTAINPFVVSFILFNSVKDVVENLALCIWDKLLNSMIFPYVEFFMESQRIDAHLSKYGYASGCFQVFRQSQSCMEHFVNILYSADLSLVVDSIILALMDCCGFFKENFEVVNSILEIIIPAENRGVIRRPSHLVSESGESGSNFLLLSLSQSVLSRVAFLMLVYIIKRFPKNLNRSWVSVWHALCGLRDCSMVPKKMLKELESDPLPIVIRSNFESALKYCVAEYETQSNEESSHSNHHLPELNKVEKILFGEEKFDPSEEFLLFANDSCRWDDGYHDVDVASMSTNVNIESIESSDLLGFALFDIQDPETKEDYDIFIEKMRKVIVIGGISDIVKETRFLDESSLIILIKSIITLTEHSNLQPPKKEKLNGDTATETCSINNLYNAVEDILGFAVHVSPPSCAWLETILVDVSLRNRDRFNLLWPILEKHYVSTLSGSSQLTYASERRISGLLRIGSRIISRDDHCDQSSEKILNLIGLLLSQKFDRYHISTPVAQLSSSSDDHAHTVRDRSDSNDDIVSFEVKPISPNLYQLTSSQIAAGIWKLLTTNIAILPTLRLEHWQTIFDLIEGCASIGGYASIKAFEIMAWILHEPRLVAEVPVFCLAGVKPLLCNSRIPASVSVAAAQLLYHLHLRLEVLVKDDGEGIDYLSSPANEAETPALWENCWLPILKALSEGVLDRRPAVRRASTVAFARSLLDKHASIVPPGVMINIFTEIYIPTIFAMVSHLNADAEVIKGYEVVVTELVPVATEEVLISVAPSPIVDNFESVSSNEAAANIIADIGNGVLDHIEDILKSAPLNDFSGNRCIDDSLSTSTLTCMVAVTRAFSRNLTKLFSFPTFDKLWLRLLHLFAFFLETNGSLSSLAEIDSGVKLLIETCESLLRDLLHFMMSENVFSTKKGLWEVTIDTLNHFDVRAFSGFLESK